MATASSSAEQSLALKRGSSSPERLILKLPGPAPFADRRPIQLISNHFRLVIPRCSFYHYDMEIRLKSERRDRGTEMADRRFRKMWHQINFIILQTLMDDCNSQPDSLFWCSITNQPITPAFDGIRNFYTSRLLTKLGREKKSHFEQDVTIRISGKDICFRVKIKFAAEINLDQVDDFFAGRTQEVPNDLIRALDIVLRFFPLSTGLPVGQSIFPKIVDSYDELSAGLEQLSLQIGTGKRALFGHYQSVRLMKNQLNLVVERTSAVVYDCQLAQSYITKLLGDHVQEQERMHGLAALARPHQRLTDFEDLIRMIDFSNPSNYRNVQKNIEMLNRELRDVQIETSHLGYKRKYKIFELTNKSVSELYFKYEDKPQGGQGSRSGPSHHQRRPPAAAAAASRRLSVYTYFQEKYQITLRATLPALNVGNRNVPSYLPLEVCRIAPNQLAKRLKPDENSKLIRLVSSQRVEQRFEHIQQCVREMRANSQSLLNEFNIDLKTEPVQVNGSRLLSPNITYADDMDHLPYFGNWGMNNKQVYEARQLDEGRWAIAYFSPRINRSTAQQLVEKMITLGQQLGMTIRQPIMLNETFNSNDPFAYEGKESIHRLLQQTTEHFEQNLLGQPQLIVFVIPKSRGDTIYKDIKREAEITFGIITQCLTDRNAQHIVQHQPAGQAERVRQTPRNDGNKILTNLLLKINAKLGGTNCVISEELLNSLQSLDLPNLMVIGSDVTHPAPSDQFGYSICSVVGTYDRHFCKYLNVVRVQSQSKEEMIKEMHSITVELLELRLQRLLGEDRLSSSNKPSPDIILRSLPKQIIYYRDGVSEGQYNQLLEFEHKNMKDAFETISAKYDLGTNFDPKVTIIVVLKRHNTRFKSTTDERPDQDILSPLPSPLSDTSNDAPADQPRPASQPNYNMPPGTLVDHPSVVQTDHEFYLCSHLSTQGTIRSTHYYVLLDEGQYTLDQLYRFSYYLCYLFAKCTKSLSIPAPVKYAHLGAYRARQHLAGLDDEEEIPQPRGRGAFPPGRPSTRPSARPLTGPPLAGQLAIPPPIPQVPAAMVRFQPPPSLPAPSPLFVPSFAPSLPSLPPPPFHSSLPPTFPHIHPPSLPSFLPPPPSLMGLRMPFPPPSHPHLPPSLYFQITPSVPNSPRLVVPFPPNLNQPPPFFPSMPGFRPPSIQTLPPPPPTAAHPPIHLQPPQPSTSRSQAPQPSTSRSQAPQPSTSRSQAPQPSTSRSMPPQSSRSQPSQELSAEQDNRLQELIKVKKDLRLSFYFI